MKVYLVYISDGDEEHAIAIKAKSVSKLKDKTKHLEVTGYQDVTKIYEKVRKVS